MAVGIPVAKNNILTFVRTPQECRTIRCVSKMETNGQIKRLYHADNLDVLRQLVCDTQVCGHVNLIYIDPPYNTGTIFETIDHKYAYHDNFTIEGYLNFMKERLLLLHKLLADNGSIYVHLDSNMLFHIKVLMDTIWGNQNFRGMITRKKCKSKNCTSKSYGNVSDYILFYTKTNNPIWNRPFEEWSDEKILKEYPCIEEGTGRRYKKVPCHAPGIRNGETGKPWRGIMPPPGKHWQYPPETLDKLDANGEIYWSANGNPRRKVYLDNSKGIPVQDIWLDFLDVNNQNTLITGYPTEKNIDMLKRIIETSSNKGDLVLDCFAGSGTTLAAAEQLGRQWIGVDIGEEAIATIQRRFIEGTKPITSYTSKNAATPSLPLFEDSHSSCTETSTKQDILYDFYEC